MRADAPTWANVFEKNGPQPTVHVLSQALITEGNLFTAVRNIAHRDGNTEPRVVLVPANEQAVDRAGNMLSSVSRVADSTGFKQGLEGIVDVFAPYDEIRKYHGPTVQADALLGRFVRKLQQYSKEGTRGAGESLKAIAATGAALATSDQFNGWEIPTAVLEPEEVTILWNPDSSATARVTLQESFTARNLREALRNVPYDNTVIIPAQYGTFVETGNSYPASLSGRTTDDAVSHQGLVTARLVNAKEVHLWTATGTQAPDTFDKTLPQGTDVRVLWSPLDPLGKPKIVQEIFIDKP